MDDRLTKADIKKKYKHVSEHILPFECDIVDIIPQAETAFSERWTFLKSLFYITDDGYYFQYNDVVPSSVNVKQEGDPFDVYLDGVLRCAYSYAYTSSPGATTGFIKQILSEGRIYVNRNRNNDLYFVFVGIGYSYLRDTGEGNTTNNTANVSIAENERKKCEFLSPINKLYDNFSKVGNFWCIKKKNERPQLYETGTFKILDISFDKIVYGDYSREYTESSVLESGYDDYFIYKDRKWGCLDGEGNIKIDILYDRIEHFGSFIEEGYVVTNNLKKGLISNKGDCIIPCQYDTIEYLTTGGYNTTKTLYLAKCRNKISVWDVEGHCIKSNLDECCYVESIMGEDNRMRDWFWIKKDGIGSIVRGSNFDSISNVAYNKFKESNNVRGDVYIIVSKKNRYGVIDSKKKVLIDYIYEDLSFTDDERLLAYKDGKCGVIDFKKTIIPIMYDELIPVSTYCGTIDSYIGVIDGKKILLDKKGNTLLSNYDYDGAYVEEVYDEYDGFKIVGCSVLKEGKWGFVDQNEFPLIPCVYDSIMVLTSRNNIVAFKVELNGMYGVVDVNNKYLIKCQCTVLYHFRTDLHNIFVYKRSGSSTYLAFIDTEIELKSKQYWQIKNELKDKGYGNIIM